MHLCPFNEFVTRIFFLWDSVHFKLSFLFFPFFVIIHYYCLRPYLVRVIPLIRTVYLLFLTSILTLFVVFLLLKKFPLQSFDEIQDFFCVILWRNLWSFFPVITWQSLQFFHITNWLDWFISMTDGCNSLIFSVIIWRDSFFSNWLSKFFFFSFSVKN